jgi:hypothetical protein
VNVAKKQMQVQTDEPMGIVISRGTDKDLAPTVLAFVWGPADIDLPEFAAA